ncbi:MAG: cell division protein FtsW [Dehalobacter sp. 4CP]|uniref:FtsW/RodA/SpoVE family cell cycle protein n=1 Tax=Dehalobacter sp. CP TaxID=2594474 RepID=UPI0013CB822F|nr:cell division protein FtsW [Dehalobacter sp. 4CP]
MAVQKIKTKKPDFILLFSAVIILAVGLIMVLSASSSFSYENTNNSYYLFFKQLRWVSLGIVAAGAAVFIPLKFFRKISGLSILVSVILLLLVEFSNMSITTKGSARWLDIFGMSVQPSEIAKLAIVFFFAYILNRYPIKKFTDIFLPVGVLAVIFLLVYKQPDLGTAIVILAAGGFMLLMTELPTGYFLAAIPLIGIPGFYLVKGEEYQWNRILGWLHPWEYATTFGYQQINAQIAFGSGGLLGIGIGRSNEGLGFLPENYTDTIFAVIGQEFGFFGTSLMLLCFIVLIGRGYAISRQCQDGFGRMLGFGITTILGIQTVINLCVVTGLFPVTGITLPLVSYGGSSLLVTMFEIGILLNISRFRQDKLLRSS